MPRKSFLYYLFSANKKPLYVDDNGHVVEGDEDYKKPNGQPATLKYSPEGWKDTLVKYARNNTWLGMIRDMTASMKFLKDGASILKNRVGLYGVEAICYLGILKLDRTGLPYNYESWYLSEIDFTKYKETITGVQASALEGGLIKYLKANQNTTYEIPVDTDPEHINVLMDGMNFDNQAGYLITNGALADDYGQHTLNVIKTSAESIGIGALEPVRFRFDNNTDLFASNCHILETGTVATKVRFDYDFGFTCALAGGITPNPLAGGRLLARSFDKNGVVNGAWTLSDYGGASNMYQHHQLTNIIEITVPANSNLFVCNFLTIAGVIASGSGADDVVSWTYDNAETDVFKMYYTYRHKSTYCKGLYPYRVLQKLVSLVSDGKYNSVSSAWLSAMKDYVITSGDALRGIVTDTSDPQRPIKGAVIKTSISEFFRSFFSRFGCGMGVKSSVPGLDDQLLFEQIAHFFQSSVITDLGQVTNAELVPAEDLSFNTIKAGYDKQDYSDVNGRYETNQGQEWTTPVTKVVRQLDLVSPYRADAFGMELLRVNLEGKNSSDSDSDNDTFIINIETTSNIDDTTDPDTVYYKLNRPAFSSVTGIPHPDSAYNLLLTPKRAIINNGAWIHSFMDKLDTGSIKFRSSDKNAELETVLSGVTLKENQDIQIGSLPAKLVLPWYISFTTQVPVTLLAIMNSNPYGKIKFTWNNRVWYGYMWDGGIKPGDNDTQVWKMLSSPENDLSKFNESF